MLRAQKIDPTKGEGGRSSRNRHDQGLPSQAMDKVESSAKKIIAAVAEGDMLRTQLAILRRLVKHEPFNTIELRGSDCAESD